MSDEYKITPAMIKVGQAAWAEWMEADESSTELLVAEIYRRMRALEVQPEHLVFEDCNFEGFILEPKDFKIS